MSLQSVLLTGATGSLGAVILEQLLSSGAHVTAVLRSFKSSKSFLEQNYSQQVASSQLKFAEIPDMAVPHVFDAAAKTVTAIMHVATPLGYKDFKTTLIEPASAITANVLEAAAQAPSVKRVIITSSIVAAVNLPSDLMRDVTFSAKDFNSLSESEALQNVRNAYSYSKVTADKLAWGFMEKEKRAFDLVTLLVPSIMGRSIQQAYTLSDDMLGGIPSTYQQIFDRETVGFLFPFFM